MIKKEQKVLRPFKSVKQLNKSINSRSFDFNTLSDSSFSKTRISPGPGEYLIPTPIQPSYSIKGFGALINRERRFNSNFVPRNPGPGTYESPNYKTITINSPFARQLSRNIEKKSLPAPVHYDMSPQKTLKKYNLAFKSQIKRMELPNPITPAPWYYNPSLPPSKSCLVLFKKKKEDSYIYNESDLGTPGPGMYEVSMNMGKLKTNKGKPTENKDEKKALNDNLPGPGSYYKDEVVKKADASSSFFLSKIPKKFECKAHALVPGPAYYFPKIQEKKISYVFNSRSVWM